jgi:diaminopimelate decarboxylase
MSTEKKPYLRPTIIRHRSGTMNKMGGLPALRPVRSIDGVTVNELADTYGSPCFVYSERTIRRRYRELRDALQLRWPKVQLAWSYKTCYLDAICRIYHSEGSWAEVVSDMEMHKAQLNGVPTNRIIFNGPMKDEAALEEALLGGAKIHIDHFDELAMVERLAEKHDLRPGVAIRLNINTGTQPKWDRFGFNLDSGQAWDAVRRLLGGGRLRLTGLHCHLGTFVVDAGAYKESAGKLVEFANRLRREHSITLDYLDLGGGFASKARLRSQYLPGEQVSPSFSQYAEAVTDGLRGLEYPPDQLPTLFMETGRALIDDAGTLITTVVANKRLADGRRAMVVDAGVNVLFTSFWYKHDIVPTTELRGVPEPTVIYGPLCMNIDVVCDNLMLPPVEVGTKLLVQPVGAYNVTQSMQFIHLRPAVVLIGEDGQHAVIRRIETLADLRMPESVPDWLN